MGTSFGPSVRSEAGRENVILRGSDQSGEAAKGASSSSGWAAAKREQCGRGAVGWEGRDGGCGGAKAGVWLLRVLAWEMDPRDHIASSGSECIRRRIVNKSVTLRAYLRPRLVF